MNAPDLSVSDSHGTRVPLALCETCAFRPGCETFKDPYNRLRSEICALGALPFHCHDNFDWRVASLMKRTPAESLALRKELNICQGWRAEVAQRAKAGDYAGFDSETRLLRRQIASRALQLIDEAIHTEGPEKDEKWILLGSLLQMLKGDHGETPNGAGAV